MIKNPIYSIGVAVALASAVFATGCTSDDTGDTPGIMEGVPTEVTISLSARYNADGGTRADGTPVSPDNDNEKINDWFMVFVDNKGKVAKMLKRGDEETGIADAESPVEQETFKCILPSGTNYSVYAFANITPKELTAATGLTFTLNEMLDDDKVSAIKGTVWKGLESTDGKNTSTDASLSHFGKVSDVANVTTVSNNNLNLWDIDNKGIPMSGFRGGITVSNTIEETFSIEVVRMVAKVQFKFTNPTQKAITVNGVALEPVTVTPVSLFPNGSSGISYDFLGNSAFTPVADAEYARLSYNLATPVTVKASTGDKDGTASHSMYIKESLATGKNEGVFTVWLNVSHADGVQDYVQYNITNDIRDYINRNDWIVIPITLTEYDVRVEALFYPPIGGYPAFLSKMEADGSQVFTFGTQGEFSIVPYVTDKTIGTHIPSNQYSFTIDEILGVPLASVPVKNGSVDWKSVDWSAAGRLDSSNPGIFSTVPKIEPTSPSLPDEILGELGTGEGIARLKLTVNTYNAPYTDGATPDRVYTRLVYIIRDNNATN